MYYPKYIASFEFESPNDLYSWSDKVYTPQSYKKEEVPQAAHIYLEQDFSMDAIKIELQYYYQGLRTLAVTVLNKMFADGSSMGGEVIFNFFKHIVHEHNLSDAVAKVFAGDMCFFLSNVINDKDAAKGFELLVKNIVSGSPGGNIYYDNYSFLEFNAYVTTSVPGESQEGNIATASRALPGMNQIVRCAVQACPSEDTLWNVIQHINDSHKWSREKIADWLDELADKGEVNIDFSPWEKNEPDTVDFSVVVEYDEEKFDALKKAMAEVPPLSDIKMKELLGDKDEQD